MRKPIPQYIKDTALEKAKQITIGCNDIEINPQAKNCVEAGYRKAVMCEMCLLRMDIAFHIGLALMEQRERHMKIVRATGEAHSHICGKDVPQRITAIAAGYINSGYTAKEIMKDA